MRLRCSERKLLSPRSSSRRRQAALSRRGQAVHGAQKDTCLEGCRRAGSRAGGACQQRVSSGDADSTGGSDADSEAHRNLLLRVQARRQPGMQHHALQRVPVRIQ